MLPTLSHAQDGDVSFVVIGKTANFRQNPTGSMTTLNYHLFAEIFLKNGGKVTNAKVNGPTPKSSLLFEPGSSVLEGHGKRYKTHGGLDRAYPDGTYSFTYSSPSGDMKDHDIPISNIAGKTRIPKPANITLFQGGFPVTNSELDVGRDFRISWTPFKAGDTDPNGIVDDLVFAVLGDCHGNKLVHSGVPFSDGPYLTYSTNSLMIGGSVLHPGETYQIFVEHAIVDTNIKQGVIGLATFAATSFLDFKTAGEPNPERKACPAMPKPIDRGMTDRYDASANFERGK